MVLLRKEFYYEKQIYLCTFNYCDGIIFCCLRQWRKRSCYLYWKHRSFRSNTEANTETASTESTSTAEGAYEDNFAVPTEDATAFAKKIQDAVAAEDLNALADLVNYPVYVALGDGSVIENREDLIALGADKIFTPELKDSMANADLSELSPSMAGFTLYSTGDGPNITFNVQNGVLGISGINY